MKPLGGDGPRRATGLRVYAVPQPRILPGGRRTRLYDSWAQSWKQWVCGDPDEVDGLINSWNNLPGTMVGDMIKTFDRLVRTAHTRVDGPHCIRFNGEQRWHIDINWDVIDGLHEA